MAVITLMPSGGEPPASWICVTCVDRFSLDMVLNIGLFVPLGFLLARLGWPASRAFPAALAITVGIELTQMAIPGRHPTPVDVLMNGSGAALGHWLGRVRWAQPAARRRTAMVIALVGILQFPLTTWALSTSSTGRPGIVGLVGHTFPNYVPFRGTVLTARLQDLRIPYGPFDDPAAVAGLFDYGQFTARTVIAETEWAEGRALIAAVADGEDFLFELAQVWCSLSMRMRRNAANVGLNNPGARMHLPCPVWKDTLTIVTHSDTRGVSIDVVSAGYREQFSLSRSPAHGWMLVFPFGFDLTFVYWPTVAWLLALGLVVTTAWTWAYGPRGTVWAVVAGMPVALWVTAWLLGVPSAPVSAVAALIVGGLAGSALGWRFQPAGS